MEPLTLSVVFGAALVSLLRLAGQVYIGYLVVEILVDERDRRRAQRRSRR